MKKNKLASFVIFTMSAIGTIYAINKTISVLANRNASLGNSNGLKYNWRLGDIFYTKQGNGKPLLLIHDLTCGSSDLEWKSIISSLTKDYTVYTIDLLGCGRSDKPALTYTNYMYVQLITDFIKDVIGERTNVVTSGASSSFTLMASHIDDSLFDKIMMINPTNINATSSNDINGKLMMKFIELPLIGTLYYNIKNCYLSYRKLFHEHYFDNPNSVRYNLVKNYYDAAHYHYDASKYLYASISINYTDIDVTKAVKNIDNIVTIIAGESEDFGYDIANEYVENNSSIDITVIEKTKHLPQLENPNSVINAIKKFF